jgi:hypothetical protein
MGWRYGGGWPPWELPSLSCDPLTLSHFLAGSGAAYRENEKTGGRGPLPAIFLTPQKSDCTPKFFLFGLFLAENL